MMPLIDWNDRRAPTIVGIECKVGGIETDHQIQTLAKSWSLTHADH